MGYPTQGYKLTDAQLDEVRATALLGIRSTKPSPASWEAGMAWYDKAHEFVQGLSEITGVHWHRLAWALAALSPMNAWRLNKIDLVDLVTTGDCKSLGPCKHKAHKVLAGEEPLEVLGGQKVLSFGDNIAYPKTSRAVTIDRHIIKLIGMPDRYIEKVGVYEAVADAFRRSARGRGILPHQLQAAMWVEAKA